MRKGMEKRKENFQPDSLVKKICTKVYDYNSFVTIGNYDFVQEQVQYLSQMAKKKNFCSKESWAVIFKPRLTQIDQTSARGIFLMFNGFKSAKWNGYKMKKLKFHD